WRQLTEMFDAYNYGPMEGVAVEIETAGTIAPRGDSDWEQFGPVYFNVSPKLKNSGNPKQQRYRPKALVALRDQEAIFKFVVTGPDDLVEIDEIVAECDIQPDRVYL